MASNRLTTQVLWIETDPTTYTSTSLYAGGQLGQMYEKDGKKYQLVQNDSDLALAAGNPVCWVDRVNFKVSTDIEDCLRNNVAGVALCTVAASAYCFIQVRGNHAAITGNVGASAGDILIMGASDAITAKVTAGTGPTYIPLAVATATTTASATAGDIVVPLNGE